VKVIRALRSFGAPLTDVRESDFASPGVIFQIGIPPRRIDLMTEISGVEFQEAWDERSVFPFGPFEVPFLSKAALIKNKRATGRPKDVLDLDELEKL